MSEVLDKLKKLLRLSGSSNEHEAALALEKAQQLAMENGIALASIDANEQGSSGSRIGKERFNIGRSTARNFVLKLLINHFGVGAAVTDRVVFLYGTEVDISFAAYLCPFLMRQFRALWRAARDERGLNSEASYYAGLCFGLSARLKKAQASQEWGLILASKQERVNEAIKADGIESKRAVKRDRNNADVYAGFQASGKVNINRPIERSLTGRAELAA